MGALRVGGGHLAWLLACCPPPTLSASLSPPFPPPLPLPLPLLPCSAEYTPRRLLPPNRRAARLHSGLYVEYFQFVPSLGEHLAAAALVISHAGSGSIFESLRLRRPLVVVPNPLLMDNHQVELAEKVGSRQRVHRVRRVSAATCGGLAVSCGGGELVGGRGGGCDDVASRLLAATPDNPLHRRLPPSLPPPLPDTTHDLQLERDGHLFAATTDNLAAVVAAMDPSRLLPYAAGDPAGIVRCVDAALGMRPKPL